jgi:hypothetical protein
MNVHPFVRPQGLGDQIGRIFAQMSDCLLWAFFEK